MLKNHCRDILRNEKLPLWNNTSLSNMNTVLTTRKQFQVADIEFFKNLPKLKILCTSLLTH